MSQDSEKLKRELKFIEDSFKAGIISESEYDVAKGRVLTKLEAVEKQEEEELNKKESPEKEGSDTLPDNISKNEEKSEKRQVEESAEEIVLNYAKKDSYEKKEDAQHKEETEKSEDNKTENEKIVPLETYHEDGKELPENNLKSTGKEDLQKDAEPSHNKESQKKEKTVKLETYGAKKPFFKNYKLLFYLAVLLFLIILMFSMNGNDTEKSSLNVSDSNSLPVCSTDLDCYNPGLLGECINPDTKDAECSFTEPNEVNITIISSDDCMLCDTGRMKNSLIQLYPGANFEELDMDTARARGLILDLNIDILPVYIFDSSVEDSERFESTRQTLDEKDGSYVMKPTASGSNFFFERQEKIGRIDLFIDPFSTTSQLAFENLMELSKKEDISYEINLISKGDKEELIKQVCIREELDLEDYLKCFFDGGDECLSDAQFSKIEKCIDSEGEVLLKADKKKADELYINTAPVFLLNNQFKKGGSLSVDILEDFYCSVNGC